jgi:hypothetical protein
MIDAVASGPQDASALFTTRGQSDGLRHDEGRHGNPVPACRTECRPRVPIRSTPICSPSSGLKNNLVEEGRQLSRQIRSARSAQSVPRFGRMGKKIAPSSAKNRLPKRSRRVGRANRNRLRYLKTPPGLRRAAFDITFPPTGSSSLPCQRRLRKLRGSTMPWRRFLLRSLGLRSAWSPEPNISYHGAQTTVKPSFSTRSQIFDLPLTLSPLSANCRPWSLIYRPQ